jgi:hypothetical protein
MVTTLPARKSAKSPSGVLTTPLFSDCPLLKSAHRPRREIPSNRPIQNLFINSPTKATPKLL